jgi:radical SAM enzyme (TIGR01210 family)
METNTSYDLQPRRVEIETPVEDAYISLGHKVMSDASRKIRSAQIPTKRDVDLKCNPVSVPFPNSKGKNAIIVVPSGRCGYDKCAMCDYGGNPGLEGKCAQDTARLQIEAFEGEGVRLFKENNYRDENTSEKVAMCNVVPAGSWYNQKEINPEARRHIEKRAGELLGEAKAKGSVYGFFATESRLESISEEDIAQTRKNIGPEFGIEVGYGWESASRLVNEALINKGLPENYLDKIKMMRKYGVSVAAHIFVGAPGLTERETVEDVAYSIKEAKKSGAADHIIIMPANAKENSVTGKLAKEGLYQLPSLWATFKAIEIAGRDDPSVLECSMIAGIDCGTQSKYTTTCPNCETEVRDYIRQYRMAKTGTEKLEVARKALATNCQCHEEWESRIGEEKAEPLGKRIMNIYSTLSEKVLGLEIKKYIQDLEPKYQKVLQDQMGVQNGND